MIRYYCCCDWVRAIAVRTATDLSPKSAASELGREGFRPDFTHQLFDEERLEGYEDGDVTIELLHTATSLHWLVKVRTSDNDATRYHIPTWHLARTT